MNAFLSLASHLTTTGFNGIGMRAGFFDFMFDLIAELFGVVFQSLVDSIFFLFYLLLAAVQ